MDSKKKRVVLAASVAGLMAAASLFGMTSTAMAAEGMESCYGINACKGTGACGGKGHACAGKNGCKGQGAIEVAKGSCLKIQGGSLAPQA